MDVLTVQQLAQKYNYHERSIRRKIQEGKIEAKKFPGGNKWYVRNPELPSEPTKNGLQDLKPMSVSELLFEVMPYTGNYQPKDNPLKGTAWDDGHLEQESALDCLFDALLDQWVYVPLPDDVAMAYSRRKRRKQRLMEKTLEKVRLELPNMVARAKAEVQKRKT